VKDTLLDIFQQAYRELRPRAPIPILKIEFFPFANVNNTIRLRDGELFVRLSDLLQGSPEPVLRAIAHILLAKMYRKPLERQHTTRYRRYVASHDITKKVHLLRQVRGRKQIATAKGAVYDLEEIFDRLNAQHFHGLLARPQMTWSRAHARRLLAHYDPAHNAIVVSRIFDHPSVPRFAVDYIVYHEMLHLKHPVKLRGSRRCVHSAEFHGEEKLFPQLTQARDFLKRL
jgi:predicted metal-dependent hydrolase